jgi:hypothetical protein
MSYLHAPRLAFAGRVLTDVPTINNSVDAYGQTSVLDPGWNPLGGGAFDLLGCTITGGERSDGRLLGVDDPEHGLAVVGVRTGRARSSWILTRISRVPRRSGGSRSGWSTRRLVTS